MAIFTRAQSNPMFPQNLPNPSPNPQYQDLGQSLDSIFNNYLRSKQLGLQEKQFGLQQTRADLENQQIQNQMAQQQMAERVRYGGTITGQNPTYSPEQIQAALGPAPAPVQASIPYNLVNPNLYQPRTGDAMNPPQNVQVGIPQPDPLSQLRSGIARDQMAMNIPIESAMVRNQLNESQIYENRQRGDFYKNRAGVNPVNPGTNDGGTPTEMPKGKMIPAPTLLNLNEGKAVSLLLPEVAQALEQNLDILGPIKGRAGSLNPYDTRAQTVDARFRTASQAFGRVMEGGVLRKEDEEKYRKMFPQLTDKPEVAKNKLAIVQRQLAQKMNSDISALRDSGYDVSGVPQLDVTGSVFNRQSPKGPNKIGRFTVEVE